MLSAAAVHRAAAAPPDWAAACAPVDTVLLPIEDLAVRLADEASLGPEMMPTAMTITHVLDVERINDPQQRQSMRRMMLAAIYGMLDARRNVEAALAERNERRNQGRQKSSGPPPPVVADGPRVVQGRWTSGG